MGNRHELHEGINGSGHPVWLVMVISATGSTVFIHRFDNKPEAVNWMRWA